MKLLMCTAIAVLGAVTASAGIDPQTIARLGESAQAMRASRASIPQPTWDRARCVAVIPDLKKAAGVMGCRAGDGWSAPVFIRLAKESWGLQSGAERIDIVLLVMNESGVQRLLKNSVTLGTEASVAPGPVARPGQLGTDAPLTAEILAYSGASARLAGINLSGGVLRPDDGANHTVYGAAASPSSILASRSISAPTEATPFLEALGGEANASAADPPAPTSTTVRSANPPVSTDSDLRATIVAMQQALDLILNDHTQDAPNAGATGTTGAGKGGGATITVSREQIEQLRRQIDLLIAALTARGQ